MDIVLIEVYESMSVFTNPLASFPECMKRKECYLLRKVKVLNQTTEKKPPQCAVKQYVWEASKYFTKHEDNTMYKKNAATFNNRAFVHLFFILKHV